MQLANFIGGRYSPPENGQYLPNIEPATGQVYGEIPDSDHRDIETAVAAAQAAVPLWSKMPAAERSKILFRVADLLEDRLEDFAVAESKDQGKPLSLARSVDVPRAVANFRFFAGAILHDQTQAMDMDGKALNYVHRSPVGIAGLISPWNLPIYLLTWKMAPALAAGNCIIAKPSELTSATAHMLGALLNEAGLPPGAANLVLGAGFNAGAALVRHPKVPLISFTGGPKTAVNIQTDAAPFFKKLGLELGGKNPTIIFGDADLDKAVPGALRAAFANQGEICLCGSRLLVEETVYDRVLEAMVAGAARIQVGDPMLPTTDMGALVSAAHRDKVAGYCALAQEEGGQLHCGGGIPELPDRCREGFFLEPTIFSGLDPGCRVMQEEIFGPVLTITPFKTEEEAIAIANGTAYGLSASIWTQNLKRAHSVAQNLEAGVIWVNTWLMRDLRTPFGGMKASGVGRVGGQFSLNFFSETRNICIAME